MYWQKIGNMLINRITAYLALAGGFIVTLLIAFLGGKSAGKQQEQAKHAVMEQERTEAQLHEIKRHQEIINRNGRATRDDVLDSLRKGDF